MDNLAQLTRNAPPETAIRILPTPICIAMPPRQAVWIILWARRGNELTHINFAPEIHITNSAQAVFGEVK